MIPAEPDKFAFVIPDKLKFKTLPDIDVPTPEPVTIKSPPKGIVEVDDDESVILIAFPFIAVDNSTAPFETEKSLDSNLAIPFVAPSVASVIVLSAVLMVTPVNVPKECVITLPVILDVIPLSPINCKSPPIV